MSAPISITLAGNPNSGKTTLFNALTGARQRVGNWPGVTVEKKEGYFNTEKQTVRVTDLPGTYSLFSFNNEHGLDEQIARDYLLESQTDFVFNVVDAANLERNLYLTLQLIEWRLPVVVVLTMMDVAKRRRQIIDISELEKRLGVPVIALPGPGKIKAIKNLIQTRKPQTTNLTLPYPDKIRKVKQKLFDQLKKTYPNSTSLVIARKASLYLEGGLKANEPEIANLINKADNFWDEEFDIVMADTRYEFVHELCKVAIRKGQLSNSFLSQKIDTLVLNRIIAIPLFFFVMYMMFLVSINIGGAFQDFFDGLSQTLFVDAPSYYLSLVGLPHWLIALIAHGLGKGINTTITFIPVIAAMFFCLAFLEASGYMARAAFVMDKLMRSLGLPGKAFVPLIVGFGCNVPAIMATRTLESERDRVLTIMMSPFMSCSARLAIFSVFVAAFFPQGGQNIVFSLYVIGIVMALFTGLLLRKTLLKGQQTPLVIELPAYHWPKLSNLLLQTWSRLKHFIIRAGRLIVPVCIILGALNSLSIHGALNNELGGSDSILAVIGQTLTPLFSPMGISQDNWPATVGLFTGTLAKEVVVGTLNTLYAQSANVALSIDPHHFAFIPSIKAAFYSIWTNLAALPEALKNPVLASSAKEGLENSVYGVMVTRFVSLPAAYAYLLFVLLYVPCVSTLAVIRKELNHRWMWFSLFWSTGIAYGVAVCFYQLSLFNHHPLQSSVTVLTFCILVLLVFVVIKRNAREFMLTSKYA